MATEDWLYRISSPIIAASSAANLSGQEKQVANGYAWLAAKHKSLDILPVDEAKKQYESLDTNVQESLKSIFGNAEYLKEDPSLVQSVMGAVTKPVEWAWNSLGGYTEGLSNVFRVIATGQSWDATFDGKKVFDKTLEKQVDNFYSPEVSNIAKKIASGVGFGEVLASLSTDAEFNAFAKYAEGDQTFKNAVRDYENSKISWGRSFARLFGLSPDIGKTDQGVEGSIYNIVSGAADLAGDIAFDPLTYIAMPIKAVQGARFGLLSLVRANQGEFTMAQKALMTSGKLVGKDIHFGYEAAFQVKSVQKAWDTIGEQVKIFSRSKEAGKANALTEIQRIFPTFDASIVEELSRGKVYNSNSALQWFKDGNSTELILKGQVGSSQGMMPRYGIAKDARLLLSDAVRTVSGFSKEATMPKRRMDDALRYLAQHGQSVHEVMRAKQINTFSERAVRMTERALVNKTIYLGGKDSAGRSLNASSAGTIYSLARLVLPRQQAKLISNMYSISGDYATSRNIVKGLFDTIADHYGIAKTGTERIQYNNIMSKWEMKQFGEDYIVDPVVANAFPGMKAGSIHKPSQINGEELAVAGNQVTDRVLLPDIGEIARINKETTLAKAVSKSVNGAIWTFATDIWSTLNLLPRLGIRSVIDESIMQALVAPLDVALNMAKGYQSGIVERIIGSPDKLTKITPFSHGDVKSIGFVARAARPFLVNLTEDQLKLAKSGPEGLAQVFVEKISESPLAKLALINEEDKRILANNIRYGYSDEMRAFGEATTRSMTMGEEAFAPSMATARYNMDIRSMEKELGVKLGGQKGMIYKGGKSELDYNSEYIVNFFIQLSNRVDRNGNVGKMAVKYMNNPKLAVEKIAEHLRTDGAEYYSRFDRSRLVKDGTRSIEQDALDMYLHVRKLFVSDAGEVNKELLKIVRKGGKIDGSRATLEDFATFADKLPESLFGYGAKNKGYRRGADLISDIADKGFQVADRQISTLTREPVYKAYVLSYGRDFASLEKAEVAKLVKNGMEPAVAKDMAARKWAQHTHDMSINRMLGFIDNPDVRTVLALNARNVSRYYRASEDFARRAMRVVQEPQALVRLRMAMNGLDHSGFIHEDENGDKYFLIPVDQVIYPVYAWLTKNLLGTEPKDVMPLDFSGKLKMLTPSADPESWAPTFSGPFMAMGLGAISSLVKNMGYPEAASNLDSALLGPYAENKTFIDAISPTALKRTGEMFGALFNKTAFSEQVTSAFFKSAAFYTANGMGLDSSSTLAEREQFMRDVQATARNVVALRASLGLWMPVAPTISETKDVSKFLQSMGTTSWRTEFRSLVEAEYAKGNPNAYDDALMKWTKLFPGRLVYTVPETELNTVAQVKKTKQAVTWIKKNEQLAQQHRQGSVFLMPQMNAYDIDAYAFLKREGYIQSKTMDQYLEDIANIKSENEYFDMRDNMMKQLQNVATPQQAQALSAQFDVQLQNFKESRPYLKLALEHNSTGNQMKIDVLNDTREMLRSNLVPNTYTVGVLKQMIREYDMFKLQLDSIDSSSDRASGYKDQLRSEIASKLETIAGINPNAMSFYSTILKRLIEA